MGKAAEDIVKVAQVEIYGYKGKRALDVGLSVMGIIILSPMLLLISSLILLCDGRPVLFRQSRIGLNRRPFSILKFRTMNIAESLHSEFEAGSAARVTVLGAFLRRTKIDELPQLINVLMGSMSIVGPRPEVESWTLVYKARWDRVLRVKPGITDWAAIEFRNEETMLAAASDPQLTYRDEVLPRKLDYYERYTAKLSIIEDLKIVVFTFLSLLK